MKRKFLLLFTMIFALVGVAAVFGACKREDEPPAPTPGAEKGEYYCTVDGVDYTLSLGDGCSATLDMSGEKYTGSYVPNGSRLEISFTNGDTFVDSTATYAENVLTLSFKGTSYRFLRMIDYTVSFDTDGGSSVSPESVLNGKTFQKPSAPTKSGYVFVGWYADKQFNNLYNFNRPVTSDLTLFARFVEQVVGMEFTVTFDLGYEGAVAPEPMQTVGGVAYAIPDPEREDAEFVGWWVSHYNSADKLTYRYNEQKLTDDTTLFAVWKSKAPVVSVETGKVEWSADGVNNNYTVTITDAQGAELYSRTSGATSLNPDQFDFAKQPAGEYVVSVTLGDETTQAFFKNRALATPKGLRVEESTFMFNPVEHAEHYILTMTCGSIDHDHTAIDLGDKTDYDFGACEMPKGGFVFSVVALADDWMSSASDTFPFTRTLDAVAGLTVDPATDVASWQAVDHAASYFVTVLSEGEALFEGNIGLATSFDLQSYGAGNYTVKVRPVARGWFSPDDVSFAYGKTKLATPQNVHVSGSVISWDAVAGAEKYSVKIGGKTYETSTTDFTFTDEHRVDGQTEYTVSVSALGATANTASLYSAALTVHDGAMTDTLVYEEGILSWEPVFGAKSYEYGFKTNLPLKMQTTSA